MPFSGHSDVAQDSLSLGLLPRLIAAGWFSVAGGVPVIFFFLAFGGVRDSGTEKLNPFALWLFGIVPVSSAALAGFTVGSRIVDPTRRPTSGRAALRGISVALLSYVLFMAIYFGSVALSSQFSGGNRSFENFPYWFLMIFVFGLIFVGWLIVIVGAIAGLLLHEFAAPAYLGSDLIKAPRVPASTANKWVAIAVGLFLLNYVIGLLSTINAGGRTR